MTCLVLIFPFIGRKCKSCNIAWFIAPSIINFSKRFISHQPKWKQTQFFENKTNKSWKMESNPPNRSKVRKDFLKSPLCVRKKKGRGSSSQINTTFTHASIVALPSKTSPCTTKALLCSTRTAPQSSVERPWLLIQPSAIDFYNNNGRGRQRNNMDWTKLTKIMWSTTIFLLIFYLGCGLTARLEPYKALGEPC